MNVWCKAARGHHNPRGSYSRWRFSDMSNVNQLVRNDLKQQTEEPSIVRFWHLADILKRRLNVRLAALFGHAYHAYPRPS
jgi:hypothetical protein